MARTWPQLPTYWRTEAAAVADGVPPGVEPDGRGDGVGVAVELDDGRGVAVPVGEGEGDDLAGGVCPGSPVGVGAELGVATLAAGLGVGVAPAVERLVGDGDPVPEGAVVGEGLDVVIRRRRQM